LTAAGGTAARKLSDGALGRGALLFALAFLCYLPSLECGFVWDDDAFLTDNPLIHASDGLRRFWTTTEPPDFFPLTSTSLWLEWRLWGDDATGYHATNVLLHAASCVLLWRVLLALGVPWAWLGAALFALHPVNVESVTWITQRKSTLPMAFYLLAALAYLRHERTAEAGQPRPAAYGLALGAFALALLSKTSVVMLPVVLLLLAWWRRGRIVRADVARTAPFFALSLVLGLVTVYYQTTRAIGDEVVRDDGLLSRLALAGRAVWFYLGKALWPRDLAFVYPRWEAELAVVRTYLPLAALVAALVVVGWLLARRRSGRSRSVGVAFAIYVAALLPILGFVDIFYMRYSLVADHYQYTSLIAVAAVAGAGLAWLARSAGGSAARAAAVLVLAGLGALTWRQQAAYRDLEALWTDTLAENPGAWIAHDGLGLVTKRQGRLADAERHYREALRLHPDFAGGHYNLADLLQLTGRSAEALEHYAAALRLDPDFVRAHNNRGIALASLGRHVEAVAAYERALELDPTFVEAHANLGSALAASGGHAAAVDAFERGLRARPDLLEAHFNLANSLRALGRWPDAARHYERARELAPENAVVLNGLARFLATCPDPSARDGERAVRLADELLELTGPTAAVPLDTRAAAAAAAGRFEEAARWQERALEQASPAQRASFAARLDGYRVGQAYLEGPAGAD